MDPWDGKIPLRREWQPTPVFSPVKSHGQRSLAGCSSWGHKESDMTERLNNNNEHEVLRTVLRTVGASHKPFSLCKVRVKLLSCVLLFATPWTVTYQAPLSMGFSRQEYWSGLPFPSPGDPPHPEIESRSPSLQVDALLFEPPGKPFRSHG